MAAVSNRLYVFGGLNSELAWLDTLHEFDPGKTPALAWGEAVLV